MALALNTKRTTALRDITNAVSCTLCKEPLANPRRMPCGHNYCWECAEDTVNIHTKCTLCKNPCFMDDLIEVRSLPSIVMRVQAVADVYKRAESRRRVVELHDVSRSSAVEGLPRLGGAPAAAAASASGYNTTSLICDDATIELGSATVDNAPTEAVAAAADVEAPIVAAAPSAIKRRRSRPKDDFDFTGGSMATASSPIQSGGSPGGAADAREPLLERSRSNTAISALSSSNKTAAAAAAAESSADAVTTSSAASAAAVVDDSVRYPGLLRDGNVLYRPRGPRYGGLFRASKSSARSQSMPLVVPSLAPGEDDDELIGKIRTANLGITLDAAEQQQFKGVEPRRSRSSTSSSESSSSSLALPQGASTVSFGSMAQFRNHRAVDATLGSSTYPNSDKRQHSEDRGVGGVASSAVALSAAAAAPTGVRLYAPDASASIAEAAYSSDLQLFQSGDPRSSSASTSSALSSSATSAAAATAHSQTAGALAAFSSSADSAAAGRAPTQSSSADAPSLSSSATTAAGRAPRLLRSVSHSHAFHVVGTGLSRTEVDTLRAAVAILGKSAEFSDTFDAAHTTHVVTPVSAPAQPRAPPAAGAIAGATGLRICKRTLKYMLGSLTGAFVVSFGWAEACIAAGSAVDEEPFLIDGDQHGTGAPRAGLERRRNGLPRLLEGVPLVILSPFDRMTEDDVVCLATAAGANILRRGSEAALARGVIFLHSVVRLGRQLQLLTGEGAGVRIDQAWLLDSVSRYKAQPVEAYTYDAIMHRVVPGQ